MAGTVVNRRLSAMGHHDSKRGRHGAPALLMALLVSMGAAQAASGSAAVSIQIILNPPPGAGTIVPVSPGTTPGGSGGTTPSPPPVGSAGTPPGAPGPVPVPPVTVGPPPSVPPPSTPPPVVVITGSPGTAAPPLVLVPGSICTSFWQGQTTSALVRVVCSSGQFVSIEPMHPAGGASYGEIQRTSFGPQVPFGAGVFMPGARLLSHRGVVTALQIENIGDIGELLEMLVSF